MYPIKFENLYHEKIWGGRDLELFRDNLPEGNIGESWDIACHKNGTGIVKNGEFKGTRFDDLIHIEGDKLLGTKIKGNKFPLLVKLINAREKLSIQVHPDDAYAKKVENDAGKSEAWYVIDAFDGASLIVGTKDGCTMDEFKNAIKNGNLEEYVNRIPVKKGDVYFIRSGLVHAICEGVILAEIQQNSDITYRVYDYNRGRELHVNKALDVINLNLRGINSRGVTVKRDGYKKIYLCLSKEMSLELYDIQTRAAEKSDEERFYIFTCVDGQGKIVYDGNCFENIFKGDSILIPASLGEYILKGNMKLLKSYVPDCIEVENDILSEIRKF